jgi:hypothetical protein
MVDPPVACLQVTGYLFWAGEVDIKIRSIDEPL